MAALHSQRSIWPVFFGAGLLFCAFLVLAFMVVFRTGEARGTVAFDRKRGEARLEKLQANREAQAAKVAKPGWADKEKGIARIPINAAMTLVLEDLRNKKPQASSVKVAPPPAVPDKNAPPPTDAPGQPDASPSPASQAAAPDAATPAAPPAGPASTPALATPPAASVSPASTAPAATPESVPVSELPDPNRAVPGEPTAPAAPAASPAPQPAAPSATPAPGSASHFDSLPFSA